MDPETKVLPEWKGKDLASKKQWIVKNVISTIELEF
jgi:hypothetical protein